MLLLTLAGQVWAGVLSGGRYAAVLVNTNPLGSPAIVVRLGWGQLPAAPAPTTPVQSSPARPASHS